MNIFYEINIIVSLKTISIEWERVGYKQLIEEMERSRFFPGREFFLVNRIATPRSFT